MRSALLLAALLSATSTATCKDDPPAPPDCSGPDFVVLITAPGTVLPPDTAVHVVYGGTGEETYELSSPEPHSVVFCRPTDGEGNPLDADGGEAGLGPPLTPGDGGGGAGGAPSMTGVEALRCDLWTDGPAQLTLESELYPPQAAVDLEAEKGRCTVTSEIEFVRDDGGA